MNETFMNESEKRMAEVYGIRSEHNTVYFYNGYKYNKLKDALNHAKLDALNILLT
ncbi:MAG: hypothetical protein OEQ24_12145 [Gammaproteobacteria bacterium]|nr:hypothetical protein [Gammaproteobacteria bacterium]